MIKKRKQRFKFNGLTGKQYWSIVKATRQINLWVGATRAGKTIASVLAWRVFVKKHKNDGAFLMVGRTLGTLKRNVIDEMEKIFGSENCSTAGKNGYEILTFFGTEIFLAGADNKVAVEKIRGFPSAIGVYIDEVAAIPEEVFIIIRSRMALPGSTMFATCNPESKLHWLKKNWIDKRIEKELNMTIFSFKLTDNTTLDPQVIKDLSNAFKGTVYFDRYILAIWAIAEGAVYSCFNPKIHGIDPVNLPKTFEEQEIGIDYGTQNPCVFLHSGINKEIRYVTDEYYWNGREKGTKLNSQYAEDFAEFLEKIIKKYGIPKNPIKTYIDPSANSLIQEFKKNKVLDPYRNLFVIRTPDNSVDEGIKRVAIEINSMKLYVVEKNCPNLINEFGAYVWDKTKDEPVSAFNHALDSLRYQVYTRWLKTSGGSNSSKSHTVNIDSNILSGSFSKNEFIDNVMDQLEKEMFG